MVFPKQHIPDLAALCLQKGIRRVVISPGSRSAPLIRAFHDLFGDRCVSIVDERSAAFYALGLALADQAPVALLCTSGTAVLNYAPALAEAYYQQVPLLAITADRPHEWIDQQDNQTLRQHGIFAPYVKASLELPQAIGTAEDLWYAHRIINEAVDLTATAPFGPVHLNVPLPEPLYDSLPPRSEHLPVIRNEKPQQDLGLPGSLRHDWEQAKRILVVHGQDRPGTPVADVLPSLLDDPRVVILAENIANVPGQEIISTSNLLLSVLRDNSPLFPDLILHSGGQVVSKALAGYLRRVPSVPCWRIGKDHTLIDTFRHLTGRIQENAEPVYRALALLKKHGGSPYRQEWLAAEAAAQHTLAQYAETAPYCDLTVMHQLWPSIPAGTRLVLGNSSIIRYAQLFRTNPGIPCYANRGVSGIDGVISTAAGLAMAAPEPVLAMSGDLAFLYDSNAMWNRNLPPNLRILVINNQGGGIFHILKGPSGHPAFTGFVEAHHPADLGKLAEAFGLSWSLATDRDELKRQWNEFMKPGDRASVLEVRTDPVVSASVFRKLMSSS